MTNRVARYFFTFDGSFVVPSQDNVEITITLVVILFYHTWTLRCYAPQGDGEITIPAVVILPLTRHSEQSEESTFPELREGSQH